MFERFDESSEELDLPFSGRQYFINLSGEIWDSCKNPIRPFLDETGKLMVRLDWLGEWSAFSVALIMAIVFKKPGIHYSNWSKLDVMFADGDCDNLHPSNLVWKFPNDSSLEVDGFRPIPMFARYLINREGTIFDRRTCRYLNAHEVKGYYRFGLVPDIGPVAALSRHRALCMAFKPYSENVDQLYVNHLNGIKGDDRLDNLEWCTPSENRIHAINSGLTAANKPVIVTNRKTGVVEEFTSIIDVARKFNIRPNSLGNYLSGAEAVFVFKGFDIELKYEEHKVKGNPNKCPIQAMRMDTGEVFNFPTIVEAAKETGISKHAINGRLESLKQRVYPDLWQFKRLNSNSDWYIPDDLNKALLTECWNKHVVILDMVSKNVFEFNTQRDAAKFLNVCEATVHGWLRDDKIKFVKVGELFYQLKMKTNPNPWIDIDDCGIYYAEQSNSKSVLVLDARTGEISEYESAGKCSKELNLLRTTLHWRLASKGQKVYPPGLLFKYKDEPLNFKSVQPVLS